MSYVKDNTPNPFTLKRRRSGYQPFRIVTNRVNKRGEILVQFENGHRMWMTATKVDRT